MSKKYTIDQVRNIFNQEKCTLISDEYSNFRGKLSYICSIKSEICLCSFLKAKKCKECSKVVLRKKFQLNYDVVKNIFEKEGCILLEKEYINSNTPMKYICNCGNESKTTLGYFKCGQRCKKCAIDKQSGEKSCKWNPDRNFVRQLANIGHRCRIVLKYHLRKLGLKKEQKTENYVGYNNKSLYEHVTNHPNWNNVKDVNWHIDHIFPVKAFVEHNIFDFKIINALDNLQPLSRKENLIKGDKYCEQDFLKYLKSKI